MSEITEAIIAKSGQNVIQVALGRDRDGLSVGVRALPHVEDFLRSLGSGELIDVQTLGRHWCLPKVAEANGKKLLVYELSNLIGLTSVEEHGFSFRLNNPGTPLVEAAPSLSGEPGRAVARDAEEGAYRPRLKGAGNEVLNMSFLRLAGISSSEGVNFTIKGVYTREGITRLAERIEQAGKRFYREFLKPYKVVITVSTMPIPEGY